VSWLAALGASVALACSGTNEPATIVMDLAGLLTAEQQTRLSLHHDVLLRDHDIDYRVEITRDAGDLLRHGVRRFAELGVGSRSQSDRGLLLVLDPAQDRVRLEVGRNLEAVYTDSFIAYLEQRQMVPFFRADRVADGILATTELIVTRAQAAQANESFQPPLVTGAGGGGAETRAHLGTSADERFRSGPDVVAQGSPLETVDAYLAAMASRNGSASLDLYTAQTRSLLREWVITPAQMDAVARAYRSCRADPTRVDEAGERAVVRYPVQARQCAPWFLVREAGRWRLDLATAQRAVGFGAGNAWHFRNGVAHPYAFAFSDWRFDRNGFPDGS
jgi:uncharacterized protein